MQNYLECVQIDLEETQMQQKHILNNQLKRQEMENYCKHTSANCYNLLSVFVAFVEQINSYFLNVWTQSFFYLQVFLKESIRVSH